MQVNPSTAYLMLADMPKNPLLPGDTVILTAGKSAVATAAAYFAKEKYGCKVVSVIRRKDRTDDEWKKEVRALEDDFGVDTVISEEEVVKTAPKQLIEMVRGFGNGNVPLCLDCVGGKVG